MTSLRRKKATRQPFRKFTIFSEGKNTEPDYFRALAKLMNNALIDVQVVPASGVPRTIATSATEFFKDQRRSRSHANKNSFESKDEVWAVFDCDSHPKLKEALDVCRRGNVNVAYSNPCFEVWLVLHLEHFDKTVDRHQIQSYLQKICIGYSVKSGRISDGWLLLKNLNDAENRAEKMVERRKSEGCEMQSPWTDVYKLTRAIQLASTESKK